MQNADQRQQNHDRGNIPEVKRAPPLVKHRRDHPPPLPLALYLHQAGAPTKYPPDKCTVHGPRICRTNLVQFLFTTVRKCTKHEQALRTSGKTLISRLVSPPQNNSLFTTKKQPKTSESPKNDSYSVHPPCKCIFCELHHQRYYEAKRHGEMSSLLASCPAVVSYYYCQASPAPRALCSAERRPSVDARLAPWGVRSSVARLVGKTVPIWQRWYADGFGWDLEGRGSRRLSPASMGRRLNSSIGRLRFSDI